MVSPNGASSSHLTCMYHLYNIIRESRDAGHPLHIEPVETGRDQWRQPETCSDGWRLAETSGDCQGHVVTAGDWQVTKLEENAYCLTGRQNMSD